LLAQALLANMTGRKPKLFHESGLPEKHGSGYRLRFRDLRGPLRATTVDVESDRQHVIQGGSENVRRSLECLKQVTRHDASGISSAAAAAPADASSSCTPPPGPSHQGVAAKSDPEIDMSNAEAAGQEPEVDMAHAEVAGQDGSAKRRTLRRKEVPALASSTASSPLRHYHLLMKDLYSQDCCFCFELDRMF
jgi:hypothetical protein